MKIEYVSGGLLRPATWRTTYVLKPDQKVLVNSLLSYGWLAPLVVNERDQTIIDGHERWMIAADNEEIVKRDNGIVPVRWVDCNEVDAMLMHVQLNRGRGSVVAKPLSAILRKILRSKRYDELDLRRMLGMSREEFDLLCDPGLLKSRKIDQHVYSRAWVPVEAPAGSSESSVPIERPPNLDR